MPFHVCTGAKMMCSFGAAPSVFNATPRPVFTNNMVAGIIMDHIPIVNIPPFGTCSAPTNPAVIAALGSPVPCVPVTPAPWVPGSPTVRVTNILALNNTSKLMCVWAGVIQFQDAGQVNHQIP
jgi:hypothetical protein